MITASITIYGMVALTGGVFALLSVTAHADPDAAPTDRHEIPTFVRERVEIATEADARTRIAVPTPAHALAAGIATPEVFP